jgi:hypothetical protein
VCAVSARCTQRTLVQGRSCSEFDGSATSSIQDDYAIVSKENFQVMLEDLSGTVVAGAGIVGIFVVASTDHHDEVVSQARDVLSELKSTRERKGLQIPTALAIVSIQYSSKGACVRQGRLWASTHSRSTPLRLVEVTVKPLLASVQVPLSNSICGEASVMTTSFLRNNMKSVYQAVVAYSCTLLFFFII